MKVVRRKKISLKETFKKAMRPTDLINTSLCCSKVKMFRVQENSGLIES